jgi:hypothetical protein
MSSMCPYYPMYILSILLGSVIDASDAFGVSRRSSPDTPNSIGSSPVSRMEFDMSLLSDVHSLDGPR